MDNLLRIASAPDYFADQQGVIWSRKRGRSGRWENVHALKPYMDSEGYLHVSIYRAGRKKRTSVHQLVAEAFFGPRPQNKVVCHLNGNQADNRPGNLKYVTQAENIGHKKMHGTYICGDADPKAKVTDEDCRQIMKMIRMGRMTQRKIAEIFGVSESHLSALKYGRIRKHLKLAG